MSRLTRTLTGPLRAATSLRRRRESEWPRLPRPTISVGNLALGGRGKTPLVAALAAQALVRGHRPAILLRGYPVVRRGGPPQLLQRSGPEEAPWLTLLGAPVAPAHEHAWRVGDEAAWLAAVTGVPVVAHPDRVVAAHAAVRHDDRIDLFLLDDGLQTPVRADVDVVLVDPARDLPDAPRPAATRERVPPPGALLVPLGQELRRRPGPLRNLAGQPARPPAPITVCAGVGDPGSVLRLAEEAGLAIRGAVAVRDHHAPRRIPPGPLLVTEKDAVGWAMRSRAECFVLGLTLDGADAVAARAFAALPPR